jgi:hypothetical protein
MRKHIFFFLATIVCLESFLRPYVNESHGMQKPFQIESNEEKLTDDFDFALVTAV